MPFHMSHICDLFDHYELNQYVSSAKSRIIKRVLSKNVSNDAGFPTFSKLVGDSDWTINSVHNGQKDHKCESCGEPFSLADSLKRHINVVHNGQKDHKCDSCGKAFSQAGDLKRHIIAIHNDRKDHKCNTCGKGFSRARDLKKHINTVHNG